MNSKRLIVISDIHGHYESLQRLIESVNYRCESDQLIFLGDYVDRGKESLDVIKLVKRYVHYEGAVALKGNHEELFLFYIDQTSNLFNDLYFENGGKQTVNSFCKPLGVYSTKLPAKQAIKKHYEPLISFMKNLPLSHKEGPFVFTHAGANWDNPDWNKTKSETFLWGVDDYWSTVYDDELVFVFGHMTVDRFRDDGYTLPFFFPCGQKIAIDGGCSFGGTLNALIIEPDGTLRTTSVHP